MWCEHCQATTALLRRTIRLTQDGKEIIIEICSNCKYRTEIEYYKGITVRFKTEGKKYGNRTNKKIKKALAK